MSDKPLVTLAVVGYNHERFVREAIEGAFSQTYSPLEIILTDDCSTDRTFDIMQEMAAAYRGQHKVVLNRNPINLGTVAHLRKQFTLVSGDIYIGAGGDDVCLSERVEKTMAAFLDGGERVKCVWSNATLTDENGVTIGEHQPADYLGDSNRVVPIMSLQNFPCVLGATAAYRKELWTRFAPIQDGVLQEDLVLAFRARLLGEIKYINLPLVRYRRHGASCFSLETGSVVETRDTKRRKRNLVALHSLRNCDLWRAWRMRCLPLQHFFYYSLVNRMLWLLGIPLDETWRVQALPEGRLRKFTFECLHGRLLSFDIFLRRRLFAGVKS